MSADWPFEEPEDLAVFTLRRIIDGASTVLLVTHDADDGGWQFLDGGDVDNEDAAVVLLRDAVALDPDLLGLADLPRGWIAWRDGPGAPWRRSPAEDDEAERKVVDDVDKFGWHVLLVPEDDDGPPFGYTIGLVKTFAHPEIVVLGLTDPDVLHRFLNNLGEAIRGGRRFADGDSVPGFIEGFDIRFSAVPRSAYAAHFGFATWFYQGDAYPVLQCLWPDAQGLFPNEPGFDPGLRTLQPSLGAG